MTRPTKGTPEYDLWIAAIEIAAYPPVNPSTYSSKVPGGMIADLRSALEALGIDWRTVKKKNDVQRREAADRRAEKERARKVAEAAERGDPDPELTARQARFDAQRRKMRNEEQ